MSPKVLPTKGSPFGCWAAGWVACHMVSSCHSYSYCIHLSLLLLWLIVGIAVGSIGTTDTVSKFMWALKHTTTNGRLRVRLIAAAECRFPINTRLHAAPRCAHTLFHVSWRTTPFCHGIGDLPSAMWGVFQNGSCIAWILFPSNLFCFFNMLNLVWCFILCMTL